MKTNVYLLFSPLAAVQNTISNLLEKYIYETSRKEIDFSNRSDLFDVLQINTHIVAQYFDLRTVI
jgi:hypothetical protein